MSIEHVSDYPQHVLEQTEAMIAQSNAVRAAGGLEYGKIAREEHIGDIDGTYFGTDNLLARHAEVDGQTDEIVFEAVDVLASLPHSTVVEAGEPSLKPSDAALQHRLGAKTRALGLREIQKIREQLDLKDPQS